MWPGSYSVRVRGPWNWCYRWLWATMWVLKIVPLSFGGATSALNCWDISPASSHDSSWSSDSGSDLWCCTANEKGGDLKTLKQLQGRLLGKLWLYKSAAMLSCTLMSQPDIEGGGFVQNQLWHLSQWVTGQRGKEREWKVAFKLLSGPPGDMVSRPIASVCYVTLFLGRCEQVSQQIGN